MYEYLVLRTHKAIFKTRHDKLNSQIYRKNKEKIRRMTGPGEIKPHPLYSSFNTAFGLAPQCALYED